MFLSFWFVITAPPKPSKQTQFMFDAMSKTSEEERGHWDQVMENFNLIFQQMNDISLIQQDVKRGLNATKDHQKVIAKQV
jgi:hypothetical protein